MESLNRRVALITGANRGLARTFCNELLDAGIRKIYASAREPDEIDTSHDRVIPLKIDVTSPEDISAVR
jgi:NAD(P)-dependent dehydrogenase (short-subunit alcohol dehydrogenase family)